MENRIDHQGTIDSIEGNHVRVRIIQTSACSSCKAKSLCMSSEAKEKTIDVIDYHADRYVVGQRVTVCASMSMGRNAVIIAFLIPLVLIVGWVVVALTVLHIGELNAICGALVICAVYYLVLRLVNRYIEREFSFWIKND